MKIDLKWVNRNVGEEGTRIYRSETAMDPENLPEPLATVGSGVTTYSDTAIIRGKQYFYRFETFKGEDKALSNEISISAIPYSGPGPQKLIMGDYEAGYFGQVTSTEFFTGEEVAYYSGLSQGAVINNTTNWFKFAHKGKILFIPMKQIRGGVSWTELYNKGLVYGRELEETTPHTAITIPVEQLKYVTKNGDNFKVRLMKGAPADPAVGTTISTTDSTGFEGSEWNDLIYKMVTQVPVSQIGGNWSDAAVTTILDSSRTIWCQEKVADGTALCRGYNHTNVGFAGRMAIALTGGSLQNLTGSNVNNGITPGWQPVLEYVEGAI